MRTGLVMGQQRMAWTEVVRRARYTEDAGFDGWWGFDHFQPMYGDGPGECFEAYTTLAALAALTTRVRLGILVTGVTYRHPSVLAAEAITIDHASAGRLDLAIGSAWFEPEHRALGIRYPTLADRVEQLSEALSIIEGLMTTDGFSYNGRHWQLENATMNPKPVQQPHPPLWVAARGPKALRLAAKHADVWHASGSLDSVIALSSALDRAIEEEQRDPTSVTRAANVDLSQPWAAMRKDVERLRAAGFGHVIFGWPSEGEAHLDTFVAEHLGEIAAS